jgi:hypothetical protein
VSFRVRSVSCHVRLDREGLDGTRMPQKKYLANRVALTRRHQTCSFDFLSVRARRKFPPPAPCLTTPPPLSFIQGDEGGGNEEESEGEKKSCRRRFLHHASARRPRASTYILQFRPKTHARRLRVPAAAATTTWCHWWLGYHATRSRTWWR